MKDKGQASFLIIVVIAFIGIGIYAGIKIFEKQEAKKLEFSLSAEAQELLSKITNEINKKDVCTKTLIGKLKKSNLTQINSVLGDEEVALYQVGQKIGRLKIDKMEVAEVSEDFNLSVIEFKLSVSNFTDATSKEQIGLKEYQSSIKLNVDDCNSYYVAGATLTEAESRCASAAPDGIAGKINEIIIKESINDKSVFLECRSCRYSTRKIISRCLD